MWPSGGSVSSAIGTWIRIALLIAQHARWLYTHVGQETVEDQRRAQAFTDELGQWIDGCIEQLTGGQSDEQAAVDPDALGAARSLLAFFDQASLSLIGALPAIDRTDPLWFGMRPWSWMPAMGHWWSRLGLLLVRRGV